MNAAGGEGRVLFEPSLAETARRVRLIAFDFDGVFTDNGVYVFEDGREAVKCTRADGIGLAKLRRLGVEAVIISSEVNPVVGKRAEKLGLPYVHGCEDKRAALAAFLEERGLSFAQAAYVGNDINDFSCLTAVLLPIVVEDAHPDVLDAARYRTRAQGGHGAVREVCDLFERLYKV